jgi:hypothetical protein
MVALSRIYFDKPAVDRIAPNKSSFRVALTVDCELKIASRFVCSLRVAVWLKGE